MRRCLLFVFTLVALIACNSATSDPTPTLDALAAQGRTIFNQKCATCHALAPDTIIVGPSLAGIAIRAATRLPDFDARGYIELSILKPDFFLVEGFEDAMPKDFGKKLTGEELDALVAFLLTLE